MQVMLPNGNINCRWSPALVAKLDARPTGDQEAAGSFFRGDLIMKYILRSFSPFR